MNAVPARIFPSPFTPTPGVTAADVLLIAGLAGGLVAPDPGTGQLRLTPTGEQRVRELVPRQDLLLPASV